ncbi:MAG: cysteine peptidase family C39 domain-containing protein, partial [bacterium]|nr:cysteine peptidase family C39 domain-containing protein [bacterium]
IALVLFGCAWIGVGIFARSSAMNDLRDYQDSWTDDGILLQPNDYSCVPAAITMLLTEHGVRATLYEVADVAGTDIFGTEGSGVTKAGNHYGFNVNHENLTFDQFMQTGLPGIIIFKSKGDRHAAYISQDSQLNLLRVKDPVQGLLNFETDGANDYFEGSVWDCYIFSREPVM